MTDFQYGYYETYIDLEDVSVLQHTYGMTKDQSAKFVCYGGYDKGNHKKHKVFPAKYYRFYKRKNTEAPINTDFAKYIAANGASDYKTREDGLWGRSPDEPLKSLGDNSTIVYGANGVCHQMLNCVLTGSKDLFRCYVNDAPSFWLSWAVYGCFGAGGATPKRMPNARLQVLHLAYSKKSAEVPGSRHGLEAAALLGGAGADEPDHEEDVRVFAGIEAPSGAMTDRARELTVAMDARRRDLTVALMRGEISAAEFARQMNAGAARNIAEWQTMASADRFGSEDLSKYALIDPEMMLPEDVYTEIGEEIGL